MRTPKKDLYKQTHLKPKSTKTTKHKKNTKPHLPHFSHKKALVVEPKAPTQRAKPQEDENPNHLTYLTSITSQALVVDVDGGLDRGIC